MFQDHRVIVFIIIVYYILGVYIIVFYTCLDCEDCFFEREHGGVRGESWFAFCEIRSRCATLRAPRLPAYRRLRQCTLCGCPAGNRYNRNRVMARHVRSSKDYLLPIFLFFADVRIITLIVASCSSIHRYTIGI